MAVHREQPGRSGDRKDYKKAKYPVEGQGRTINRRERNIKSKGNLIEGTTKQQKGMESRCAS